MWEHLWKVWVLIQRGIYWLMGLVLGDSSISADLISAPVLPAVTEVHQTPLDLLFKKKVLSDLLRVTVTVVPYFTVRLSRCMHTDGLCGSWPPGLLAVCDAKAAATVNQSWPEHNKEARRGIAAHSALSLRQSLQTRKKPDAVQMHESHCSVRITVFIVFSEFSSPLICVHAYLSLCPLPIYSEPLYRNSKKHYSWKHNQLNE